MTRAFIAWCIAGLSIGAFVVVAVIGMGTDAGGWLWLPMVVLFVTICALLWTRVPGNPIGPLFLAAGSILVIASVAGTYADIGVIQTPPWPGSAAARTLSNVLFIYPLVIAQIGIPLVFPDGRLLSPRFRWVVVIAIVGLFSWTMAAAFGWPLDLVVLIATVTGLVGAVAAVSIRFRRGDRAQRQQVKWLAADATLAAIVFPVAGTMADPASTPFPALAVAWWILALLTLLAMPIVIGIAILRYRLYEIDRIVSRTIAYALVTGSCWRSTARPSCYSRRFSPRSPTARRSPSQLPRWRSSPCSSR